MSKFVPKDVVKQAKEIDLLTYFMNNNPSELVRKGTNTYSLKSHYGIDFQHIKQESQQLIILLK